MFSFVRVVCALLVITSFVSAINAQCPVGDLNNNCRVELDDLSILSEHWMSSDPAGEVDGLALVNLDDLLLMAENWLNEKYYIIINEFLASNWNINFDEDGDSSDWIELFNPTRAVVDLTGWYLTDSAGNLTKWQLPAVVLEPGEYLVVYASGKDRVDPDKQLHTNFDLSAAGEYLALIEPDGSTVVSSFDPGFSRQFENISFGLAQSIEKAVLISRKDAAKMLIPTDASQLPLDWYSESVVVVEILIAEE